MRNIHKVIRYLSLLCFFTSWLSTANEDLLAAKFFNMPHITMAKISPNGNFITAIRYDNTQQKIVLINTKTLNETLLMDMKGVFKENSSISKLAWIDNDHVAAQLIEVKKGVEDLLNTKNVRRLIIIKKPNKRLETVKIYSMKTKGWLVHPLPFENDNFLYAKSSLYSKVYKINVEQLAVEGKKINKLSKVDGGQFKKSNEVAKITGYVTRWFIDELGQPKAALHFNDKQELSLSTFNKDGTSVLKVWEKESDKDGEKINKKLIPIALSSAKNSFYCLDVNEDESRTIYRVNFDDNTEEVIYEANSFKIVDVDLSIKSREIVSVKVLNNGAIETVFLNNGISSSSASSQSIKLIAVVSESLTKEKSVIYQESHNDSGKFLFKEKNKTVTIAERFPALKNELQSQLIESAVNVEGLEIPYILSLPKTSFSSLIVMPHGGPIGVYDHHYYNPIVQYLVANNYAVLQVNYRGSSGYSRELKEAGKKQWGNLMLEDIYQATNKVLKRQDINADSVCSFGMSYGGYAALMLTIKHPDIFKCAASWAGVTDVNLYLNGSRLHKKQRQWLKEYVGNSNTEYQELMDISPLYNINKLAAPVFIAHGNEDEVVDIEHAYRMKLMLDKYNKQYKWFIDEKGSHSFGSPEQRQRFFVELNGFLKDNLH